VTPMQGRWTEVGEPAHEEEARALSKIRELLAPDPLCAAWTNVSIPDAHDFPTEIDLLLLNGAGLFVVELKGWRGEIAGSGYDWRCRVGESGWRPRRSPMVATQNKARRLKSLLIELKSEQGEAVQLPYVASLVVMHGRNSRIRLDDRGSAHVYGLDNFAVAGVPAFSTFLRQPPRKDQAKLDKPTVAAIRRMLLRSGMTPRRVPPTDIPHAPEPGALPTTAVGAAGPDQVRTSESPSVDDVTPIVTSGLFDGLADDDLVRLGVSAELIESVRTIVDEADLIDLVSEDVFNDLDSVLEGEAVDDIVARRESIVAILETVDAQAPAATLVGGGAPDDSDSSSEDSDNENHSDPADILTKLQSVFGDRVKRIPNRTPDVPRRRPLSLVLRDRSRIETPETPPASEELLVPSERLLDLARAEALQGRHSAAQQLLDEIHSFMNRCGTRDWSAEELKELNQRLSNSPLLAQRLELLIDGLPAGPPLAPAIKTGPEPAIGTLWSGRDLGPAYSLLLRVPDVLDRANGIYLSQLIGPEQAAEVNARLLKGRPDGGRIRITSTGIVVSRRDPDSPWFVVGHVAADEWFPAERTAAA
jgi:hypothetical protein